MSNVKNQVLELLIVEPYRVEFNAPGAMTPEVWERP
jgi:hypothetical protein